MVERHTGSFGFLDAIKFYMGPMAGVDALCGRLGLKGEGNGLLL